jgi:hypothetical protein
MPANWWKFLRKYTSNASLVESHSQKCLGLLADSRLEIAFVGHPTGFQAPSYKVCKYEPSPGLSVVFEVEVRTITRFINPGYVYDDLEIERTDYLSQYSVGLRENVDMSFVYA